MYPMPTTLVGATVNQKPNFLAVAHVGIFNHGTPQYISIGLDKARYTSIGIWRKPGIQHMPAIGRPHGKNRLLRHYDGQKKPTNQPCSMCFTASLKPRQ